MFKIREKALGSGQECVEVSIVDKVVDKEEKEMLEEEELETLLWRNICSEIMDKVMDPESDYGVVLLDGFNLERSSGRGKQHKRKNK
jgi:hypothetical protein